MMKSVFEHFHSLWPKSNHTSLQPLLSQVPVLYFPEDKNLLGRVLAPHVLIVIQKATVREILNLLDMGFEHVVQQKRSDFPQELLAASLMIAKRKAFFANPIPFFFSGFQSVKNKNLDRNLTVPFHKTSQKRDALEWLNVFLQQAPQIASIRDICLQSADELFTNALFNAPVRASGKRPFQSLPRDADLELPPSKKATLFATFSDQRVIIGCLDSYGSLSKPTLFANLREAFKHNTISPREGTGRVALGLRFCIENSAGFYVLTTKSKTTLISCVFSLKGLKANLTHQKHFHVVFRED